MEIFTEDMVALIYYILIPAIAIIIFAVFIYPVIRREKIKNIEFKLAPDDSMGQSCQKVLGVVSIIPARDIQIDNVELEFQYGMYIHRNLHSEKVSLLKTSLMAQKLEPLNFEFEVCLPRTVGDLNNYANISDEVKSFQIKHPKPDPDESVVFPRTEVPTETAARKLFGGRMEQNMVRYGWRLILRVYSGRFKLIKPYVLDDGYLVLIPNGRPFPRTLFGP